MNLTWLIVKKDIQRFRVHLASMIAIAAVLIVFTLLFSSPSMSLDANHVSSVLSTSNLLLFRLQKFAYRYVFPVAIIASVPGMLAEIILLIYVVANVLKEDAPDSDRAFWRTRPISGARMFAAKAAFIMITMLPIQLGLQVVAALLTMITPGIRFYNEIGNLTTVEMVWVAIAIYIGLSPQLSSTKRNSTWVLYFLSLPVNVFYWVYFGKQIMNAHTYGLFLQNLQMFYFFWVFFTVAAAWLLYRYRSRRLVFLAYALGLLVVNAAMTHFYLAL